MARHYLIDNETTLKHTLRLFIILALISISLPGVGYSKRPPRQTAVMVVCEGVTIDRLADWDIPAYRKLLKSGAIGLMNNKVAGDAAAASNCVTIGASARIEGIISAKRGFNAGERLFRGSAAQEFRHETGHDPGDSEVLFTGLSVMQTDNIALRYSNSPGLLGEELRYAGITTAVYGNSDRGRERRRPAVTIAMDAHGRVPYGDVGPDLLPDPAKPYGLRTDYDGILQRIAHLPPVDAFIVVEAGDLSRADACASMPRNRREKSRRLAAEDLGDFLTQLHKHLARTSDRYLLMLVVTDTGLDYVETGEKLTPVIVLGSDIQPGVLSSATTRHPGLIANLDLAPMILDFFRISVPSVMFGQPAASSPRENSLATLVKMNRRMVDVCEARSPVMILYTSLLCLAVALAVLTSLRRQGTGSPNEVTGWRRLRKLMLFISLVPVTLLVAPGLGIHGTIQSILFMLGSAGVTAIFLDRWKDDLRPAIMAIGLTTAAVVCADMLTGSTLLKRSILSYDPIVGIRFYGVGNEYAGVLIGAVLLGLYTVYDMLPVVRRRHLIVGAAVCTVVACLIGMPNYGTNFGGMLAALAGFGFALTMLHDGRSRRRLIIAVMISALALFALIIFINLRPDAADRTHIGRILNQAMQSGPSVLVDTATRKWLMNLRMLGSSIWSVMLGALALGLVVLSFRPAGLLRSVLSSHPAMNAAFKGMMAAAVVAMLTNDSGVSMAATILLYLAAPLMVMIGAETDGHEAQEAPDPTSQLQQV